MKEYARATQKEKKQAENEIHDRKEGQYDDYIKHKSPTTEATPGRT